MTRFGRGAYSTARRRVPDRPAVEQRLRECPELTRDRDGWELLIGVFTAFYLFPGKDNEAKREKPNTLVSQSVSLLGVLLIVYAIFAFDKNTPFPGASALIPTIGTALIILFATPQTFVGKLLGDKLFSGRYWVISYSAYLWHQPLFAFARHYCISKPSPSLLLSLAALALTVAYISWKYIEQPFRNKHFLKRSFLFLFAWCIGNHTYCNRSSRLLHKRFPNRYPPEDRELAGLNIREAGEYVHQ